MGFESILDMKTPVKGVTRPAFFIDLNIEQILERITKNDRGILEYFEYFPLDDECEAYRHDVYKDIKDNSLYEALSAFVLKYNEFRDIENKKNSTRIDLQKPVWHFWGMELYTGCLLALKEALKNSELKSEGFRSLKEYIESYTSTEIFGKMADKSKGLKDALLGLNVTACYENGRVQVSVEDINNEEAVTDGAASGQNQESGESMKNSESTAAYEYDDDDEDDTAEYEDFLTKICDTNEKEFVNPFASTDELTSFEQEIVKIVAKRNPDIFKEAEKMYKDIIEYEDPAFLRLADELRFYLSFYEFEQRMTDAGFAFTQPYGIDRNACISAKGLYDLALACVNNEKGKPVISNAFCYEENEMFFVLTGPNQGGKTTFARSLGQLIYFTKIGLDVPAQSASVPYFSDILTHFSVEESVETGRGKLMEELVRLSPMMKYSKENAFIVINELFTTAANYDAIIMGQNVLKHFLDGGCHGIYVTHLRELCDIDKRIAGLSAQLDENGRQNFKIQKKSVDYDGCARNQVVKYGLGYEKLKERLESIL